MVRKRHASRLRTSHHHRGCHRGSTYLKRNACSSGERSELADSRVASTSRCNVRYRTPYRGYGAPSTALCFRRCNRTNRPPSSCAIAPYEHRPGPLLAPPPRPSTYGHDPKFPIGALSRAYRRDHGPLVTAAGRILPCSVLSPFSATINTAPVSPTGGYLHHTVLCIRASISPPRRR